MDVARLTTNLRFATMGQQTPSSSPTSPLQSAWSFLKGPSTIKKADNSPQTSPQMPHKEQK
ncbi:hypothetical protein MIR68_000127 [Amoeboaphelidium protococcarum]|nr:hypothetical protein MIR68_000127 [Amoeboaphelidium protococcarum]KAI3652104.1 hypothetical protein MP228_003407 [Amoeboaphelidium protococcarum]